MAIQGERVLGHAPVSVGATMTAVQHDEKRHAAEELRRLLELVTEAHENERRQLVGELHDELASRLLRAVYAVRRAAAAPALPDPVRSQLGAVEEIIGDAERHLREIMSRVLPAAIQSLDLCAALDELVLQATRESHLAVSLEVRGNLDRLPGAAALTLLRGAEEAMLNIRKHAHATRVRVAVSSRPRAVMLVVEDDGVGWNEGAIRVAGHGLGLAHLRQRVGDFSGRVRTGRGGLGGAILIVRIPVA